MTVALFLGLVAGAANVNASGERLPSDVRTLLDQRFPGWRFATIIDSLRAELPAGARPEWIGGDYDGDRQRDYAVNADEPACPAGRVPSDVTERSGAEGRRRGTKFAASTDVINVLYGQERKITSGD